MPGWWVDPCIPSFLFKCVRVCVDTFVWKATFNPSTDGTLLNKCGGHVKESKNAI